MKIKILDIQFHPFATEEPKIERILLVASDLKTASVQTVLFQGCDSRVFGAARNGDEVDLPVLDLTDDMVPVSQPSETELLKQKLAQTESELRTRENELRRVAIELSDAREELSQLHIDPKPLEVSQPETIAPLETAPKDPADSSTP